MAQIARILQVLKHHIIGGEEGFALFGFHSLYDFEVVLDLSAFYEFLSLGNEQQIIISAFGSRLLLFLYGLAEAIKHNDDSLDVDLGHRRLTICSADKFDHELKEEGVDDFGKKHLLDDKFGNEFNVAQLFLFLFFQLFLE